MEVVLAVRAGVHLVLLHGKAVEYECVVDGDVQVLSE